MDVKRLLTFAAVAKLGYAQDDQLAKYKPTNLVPQAFTVNGWNTVGSSCNISNTFSTSSKTHSYYLFYSVVVLRTRKSSGLVGKCQHHNKISRPMASLKDLSPQLNCRKRFGVWDQPSYWPTSYCIERYCSWKNFAVALDLHTRRPSRFAVVKRKRAWLDKL